MLFYGDPWESIHGPAVDENEGVLSLKRYLKEKNELYGQYLHPAEYFEAGPDHRISFRNKRMEKAEYGGEVFNSFGYLTHCARLEFFKKLLEI